MPVTSGCYDLSMSGCFSGFCTTCAMVLEICPLCRGPIDERLEVGRGQSKAVVEDLEDKELSAQHKDTP